MMTTTGSRNTGSIPSVVTTQRKRLTSQLGTHSKVMNSRRVNFDSSTAGGGGAEGGKAGRAASHQASRSPADLKLSALNGWLAQQRAFGQYMQNIDNVPDPKSLTGAGIPQGKQPRHAKQTAFFDDRQNKS